MTFILINFAFSGVVWECLNLSQIPHFRTGGEFNDVHVQVRKKISSLNLQAPFILL